MSQGRHNHERVLAWHAPSLRGRVALLAGTVVVLLAATLLILVWVLRTTQANAVARSQKHLSAVARTLAEAYENRSDPSVSVKAIEAPPIRPLPPAAAPPRDAPPLPGPPPPPPRSRSPQEKGLEQITAKVLADDTGIEGGFYRAADNQLIGYAFPTHEGPGDPAALPARETPEILNITAAAYTSRSLQQDQFHGPHDVVLFVAVPICESKACTGGPSGAAWLMRRIPGAESDRRRELLWSAFGFGLTACVTVLFAFFVLRQVGAGTDAVLKRLTSMESDLDEQPHPANVRLAEFHRVLDGLDRLTAALRGQMARERELQVRVRQSERLAAIGQLAAGVAHELRNPLATIRLRAQMAQRKTQEELTYQGTAVILAEVDRLDAIIERLLDFSRPIHLNLIDTDLAVLCTGAVLRWRARFPDVEFRYIGEDHIAAIMDSSRLNQVLDNLLENAVHQHEDRHNAESWVHVRCREHNGTALIVIEDNAGGFSAIGLQSATEPFFTTRAQGTGLGLAITREIIHALDGSLTIANKAEGASIQIELPTRLR